MSKITTSRRIALDGLGFPASIRPVDGGYEVEAHDSTPQAQLQAAVDAAPLNETDANRVAMVDSARQALSANRTYLAIASPTAAQNTAQAKALTRQMNGVIRLLLGALDGTD